MRDYRFDREVAVNNPDGSGSTDCDFQERPHHTAIVESVDSGGAVTVLEQNAPARIRRAPFTAVLCRSRRRAVTGQPHSRAGDLWFYRPQAR